MTEVVLYVVGFIISLVLALVLTPFVIKLAYKVGAIDKPNHRKVHTRIMPRLGGLGIYAAFIGAYFVIKPFIPDGLLRNYDTNLINAMLAGGSIIIVIGALDDRFELSAKVKLLGQIIAACVVVLGFGVKIDLLNIPFGEAMQPIASWISIPLTILWIVGVTNAINLIDGLDGLAAGVSAIAIGTIMVMAAIMGFAPVILLSVLLLGGIIGFLAYNFHPAKIFMGDTGSLFLGFSLATLSMLGFKQVTIVSFLTPLLIIGVPLSDTFFAIVRRWVNKKPIFAPDKGHLHHCLRELGYSHRKTVLIIYAIATFFGICAILQSTIVQSTAANWITFAVILVLVFVLQIGAELIGIVDKSRRPVLSFIQRVLMRTEQSRSK
ncbi:undecaprenyl-phosphate alpha-N-acetylglucosaminyl 1-phosphate transferase [Paenibacillus baekrokdamisoli]|uniref:Undecaprenyl-phosphate alpha-N-acetylglucosaminyl 1-phosphate transferase n=1 Tax=Paenibacillus baekrokdamisoli TaxID=1712516 RepID=A0A3G9JIH5_9BACL|nr:MraY family glycosyltransferase [Paenibacillus baekrokdamisoli]MBB3069070.1 UDP-GlcNAc:undecaprenyl-phosphate GlcNAc-1-phosphate transferase [Paenibacillus baekrokdamisoli]BBH23888.1 undecaprenyl-phosphate alpha-N-acetylglucosaminyl 1-phosphate transferase [Paenibacillus baekrokdamisoli]